MVDKRASLPDLLGTLRAEQLSGQVSTGGESGVVALSGGGASLKERGFGLTKVQYCTEMVMAIGELGILKIRTFEWESM